MLIIYISGWSQHNAISNQYFHEIFLMNPAAAGFDKDCSHLKAFHRKQWYGFDNSPTTQILSYQGKIAGSLGTGTYLYNDKNGFNGEFGLYQAFSYEIYLIKKHRSLLSLTFGLALSVNQHSIDETSFTGGNALDPAISGSVESGWGYNAATGFMVKYNTIYGGFAMTNLLPQNNTLYTNSTDEPELPKTYHLLLGTYFKHPNRELYWEPSIYFKKSERFDDRLDLNIKGSVPSPTNDYLWFWGALSYRRTIDFDYGKDLALAPTIGVVYKSITAGLEYQIGLTSAQKQYGSAFQLVIGYRFCKRPYGGIPCSERDYIMTQGSNEKYKSKRKR